MRDFIKIAKDREKRQEALYEIDEDYSPFTSVCEKHPGVRKELLDAKEKKKLGLSTTEMAWRCPVDQEITETNGSIDQQTDGFSLKNNTPEKRHSIIENGFDRINNIEEDKARKMR